MVKKRLTMKEMPAEGTDRWRVLDYLKRAGRDVQAAEMVEALGVSVWMPSNTAGAYPELMLRVRRGVYRWGGEAQKAELEQKPVDQLVFQRDLGLFQVPALTVVRAAKQKRPGLRLKSDEDLIRDHVTINRNVFRHGRDYVGDGLDNLMLTERAARKLATHLKVYGVRDDIEESKARAAGEDHVREFNMDLLMPGDGPEGCPVSFDALVDALGLNRAKAISQIRASTATWLVKVKTTASGRLKNQYWVSEHDAKRFVLDSGISKERKKPIADYFIRKEEEALDYRQRDKEEQTALTPAPSSEFALLLARMDERDRRQEEWMRHMMQQQQQMMGAMMMLVERGTQQNVNIESYQALTTQLTISEQEKEQALLLKERAIEAVDDTIGTHLAIKNGWPFSAWTIAEELRWFAVTGSGKPQARGVTSIILAEGLAERGTGCGVVEEVRDSDLRLVTYKGSSVPTREGRLNDFGREVLRGLDAQLREKALKANKKGVCLIYPGKRKIKLAFEQSRRRIKDDQLLMLRVNQYLITEQDLTPPERMYH